ncbi:MAG: hypothetical protein GY851_05580 [bacterium]|nr:hypothetical protein [bacterium]
MARHRALNDIVLHNAESSRILTLDVSIDRRELSPYVCDGLVISTPTGSTGHSLSAGGPILAPETSAFVITAICPHSLGSRPLVVADSGMVGIHVAPETTAVPSVSVDGQIHLPLKRGDRVEVRRSRKCVRFIHLPGYSYFAVLRRKLHWRGSAV